MTMVRKIVFIAFILEFILPSYGQLMDDVCHKDDVDCKYPTIKQTGELQHGKCQLDNVLRRIHETTLLKCVKECKVTSQCVGVNYRKNWKLCDVVGDTETPLTEESGCLYSDIDSWPEALAGKCADSQCEEGNKCTLNGKELICEPVYCKDLPDTKNISVIEKFGLHRTLNTGSKAACNDGFKTTGRPYVICKKDGTWTRPICCIPLKPEHCGELPGCSKSGVYRIYPNGSEPEGFEVFCDMETDNGGWTVFQKRFDGSVSFDRNWTEYEDGFGSAKGEYWMGNKKLHQLTKSYSCTLQIQYIGKYGGKWFDEYTGFKIGDASTKYEISKKIIRVQSDILRNIKIGQKFSTKDNDNTKATCIVSSKEGGWWHSDDCVIIIWKSNLNALYNTLQLQYYFPVIHTKMMLACR